MPVPRAILWHPDQGDPSRSRPAGYVIFVEQNALLAIQEHADATPDEGILGFLVGDLCRDPESNLRYLIIDSTVRLTQRVYGDKTAGVVGKLWRRVQDELAKSGGTLLGWYHSHPPEGLGLTPDDLETHRRHFDQPYHTAVVLARQERGAVAGFFRPGETPRTITALLPFFELVPEEVMATEGHKRSRLPWVNYVTQARVSRGDAAAPARRDRAASSDTPRSTLEVVGQHRSRVEPEEPEELEELEVVAEAEEPALAPPLPAPLPPSPPPTFTDPHHPPQPPAPAPPMVTPRRISRPTRRRRRRRWLRRVIVLVVLGAVGVAVWRTGVWRPVWEQVREWPVWERVKGWVEGLI